MAEHPAAVPGPSESITLHPLKTVGNLQERYPEATADVAFVGKERLPAHRAVLSVASSVFFKMFDGDWRESRERNIPAPTEYSWEAFKAAITLLYGVEVEVDESSILDVYKVAHCYDLVYMKVVLAHAISQWDADMVDTVLELCALAGHLETEEDQRGHEVIHVGLTYIVKHLALIKGKPTGLNALSYEAMLKVVQSEDITIPELDLFLLLKQWIGGQLDITLRQAQQLYSHIRYGTIPYEFLSLGTSQDNLILTLQNHQQLSVGKTKDNLKQITPRSYQSEVLQVYPLVAGLSVSRSTDRWDFVDVVDRTNYTVGVIFSGRQEFTFRLFLKRVKDRQSKLCVMLSSLCEESNTAATTTKMNVFDDFQCAHGNTLHSFMNYSITLNSTGALLVRESHQYRSGCAYRKGEFACKTVDLPFKDPLPWILRIGVPCNRPVSMTLHCE